MVDIVVNVLPHAQVTLHSTYLGWIPSFMLISSFFTGVPSKTLPCRKPRYDKNPYRGAPCDTTKPPSMPDLFAAGTDSICRPVRLEYNIIDRICASRGKWGRSWFAHFCSPGDRPFLQIIIHLELDRRRHLALTLDVGALVLEPDLDELLREYSAFCQEVVIFFKIVQSFAK